MHWTNAKSLRRKVAKSDSILSLSLVIHLVLHFTTTCGLALLENLRVFATSCLCVSLQSTDQASLPAKNRDL